MRHTILRQVAQLGHPILRADAHLVTKIKNPKLQQLIADMIATVIDINGVGIAAPQVYTSLQVFIIASKPNQRYPYAPTMRPTALINPQLISHATEAVSNWEGCLSIPGIRAFVPRYKEVTVEYTSQTGKKITKTFDGFIARIFQHEYDHIHGLVYLDRLHSTRDIISEKEYLKLLKSFV